VHLGQIVHLSMPRGGVTSRPGAYQEYRQVDLCFNISWGAATGDVTGIKATPIQILTAIQSCEIRCDNKRVFYIENGELCALAIIYMQNVLKNSSTNMQYGLCR